MIMNATHILAADRDITDDFHDATVEWAAAIGVDPGAVPMADSMPLLYDANSGELEYSELSMPDKSCQEVGQVITRKRITITVPPPLQYWRPLP